MRRLYDDFTCPGVNSRRKLPPVITMISGPEQLKGWIERMGFKTHAKAAHFLGVTEPYLSRLLSDGRTPSLHMAIKIQELIGIPVAAWSRQLAGVKNRAARKTHKPHVSGETTNNVVN